MTAKPVRARCIGTLHFYGQCTAIQIARIIRFSEEYVKEALADLEKEGFVAQEGDKWKLIK